MSSVGRPSHPKPLAKKSITIEEDQLDWIMSEYGGLSAGVRDCVEIVRSLKAKLCGADNKSHQNLDPAEVAG